MTLERAKRPSRFAPLLLHDGLAGVAAPGARFAVSIARVAGLTEVVLANPFAAHRLASAV